MMWNSLLASCSTLANKSDVLQPAEHAFNIEASVYAVHYCIKRSTPFARLHHEGITVSGFLAPYSAGFGPGTYLFSKGVPR
jgi:hypothetical protein